jgi:hypothetical protein
MAAKLTRLTHKIAIQLYHLQFSLQAASPETFGYMLAVIYITRSRNHWYISSLWHLN